MFKNAGCPDENIDLIKVPGAFEIPLGSGKISRT